MQTDLLDAQAAIDWAVAQIPSVEKRIEVWKGDNPYSVRTDLESQPGKKLYRLTGIFQPPAIINAEAGAIINSIRSSLDLLANALARRNGVDDPKGVYFPISGSLASFMDTTKGGGLEKIKRLSEGHQAVIKDLAPYKGGNDLLFALHDLDITRKHKRLLKAGILPRGIGIIGGRDVSFPTTWPGFENEAVLAMSDPTVPDAYFQIPLYVTLDEAGVLGGKQLPVALNELAGAAAHVVKIFDNP